MIVGKRRNELGCSATPCGRLTANLVRTCTVVLFGNRLSAPVDMDGATPGGRALRFYSSVRLAVDRDSLVQNALGAAWITVKVTAAKNKVAPPLRHAELALTFGEGFR